MTRRNVLLALAVFAGSAGVVLPASAQTLALQELTNIGTQPTGIHYAPDGSGRLFLMSKGGAIWIWQDGELLAEPFLDLTALVNSEGVERGLHGLAFHPSYSDNGFFYVMYTDLNSDSNLVRYEVSSDDANVADPSSAELLLFVEQPDEFHNISQLQFGPNDGYLYIGAGDGGFIGDPDNRAQTLSDLLGKILRIDIDGDLPYAIPPDNPFLDTPGARAEIWALGVRNPWRFSFDRLTGDLYMGDVGQFTWEEVNFQPANSAGGENYGWNDLEGLHCYDPPMGCFDPSYTLPIAEYEHGFFGGPCAVTGGYVYRGASFPRFQGLYFYADWCTGEISTLENRNGQWIDRLVLDTDFQPNTFGEDTAGELYVGDNGTGDIFRLVDPVPFCDVAASQLSYSEGDTVRLSVARLANYGETSPPLQLQVGVVPPSGGLIPLIDIGGDGSFNLPAGADDNRGPIDLVTVDASTPTGSYSVACRLVDPDSGFVVSTDLANFEVE